MDMKAPRMLHLWGILLLLSLLIALAPASQAGAQINGSPWETTTEITDVQPALTVFAGTEITFSAVVGSENSRPHPPADVASMASMAIPWVDLTFLDGAVVLGTANTGSTGIATFSTSTLSVGVHSITARFAGAPPDFNGPPWESSTSAPVIVTVLSLTHPTKTTLTSSVNPSAYGQGVTFTANVTTEEPVATFLPLAAAPPTGQVTFSKGGVVLATASLVNGQATFSTATLPSGTHFITAKYLGSAEHEPSQDTLTQVVLPASKLVITKTSSANPSPLEDALTYTITVFNGNAGTLRSVSVEDVLPAGLTYVSSMPAAGYYDAARRTARWELGDLLSGARRELVIVAQPDPTIILETTDVTNLARAWAQETPMPIVVEQTTTITVATPPALIPRNIILRQGEDDYAGHIDTYLDFYNPRTAFGDSVWTYLRTVDMATLLTRFDLSPLPAGAQITKAQLRLYVSATYPLNVPITVKGYRLLRFWNEDTATWLEASPGDPWEVAGANGRLDRMDVPELEQQCFSLNAPGASLNRLHMMAFDVTALTRDWLAEPETNFGVILKASICRGTALYRFFSSESRTLERRPELYIEYLAPAGG